MGEQEARTWLGQLLVKDAGFTEDEAQRVVEGVFASPERLVAVLIALGWNSSDAQHWAERHVQDRPGWLQSRLVSVATAARATSRLPDGKQWWNLAGGPAKDLLLEGNPFEDVECRVAEAVYPARDCWDPNWPESKRFFAVDLPAACAVGDIFLVGDGMGMRGTFRVEDREGRLGAQLIESWYVLHEEWDRSSAEAASALNQ